MKDWHPEPEKWDNGVYRGAHEIWGSDQHMISLRLRQYAMRYGADKVYLAYETRNFGRIDRGSSNWWLDVDKVDIGMNRDSHFLQNVYRLEPWWKYRYMMESMYPPEVANQTGKYLEDFIEAYMEDQETWTELGNLKKDQELKEEVMNRYGIDIYKEWSEFFPRIYTVDDKFPDRIHKMKWNTDTERLYREVGGKKFYVVPKLDRKYALQNVDGKSIPVFCEKNCEQVQFNIFS